MKIALQDEIPAVAAPLAGVDEAGRGPLVGAVVAAAVILDPARPIDGLNDSKKLTAARREQLAARIRQQALAWALASIDADTIDRINILQATLLGMRQAVAGLAVEPAHVFVDGNRLPDGLPAPAHAIVKGDARVAAISAASILAKVERDRQMLALHRQYPAYGFDRHKGYPTKAHVEALQRLGPCPQHRRSFAPVKRLCE